MKKHNKLRRIAITAIVVAGAVISTVGILYTLDNFNLPFLSSSTSASSPQWGPSPENNFTRAPSPSPLSSSTPGLTPTPPTNENYSGQGPKSIVDKLTPTPVAQNGNGKPQNNLIDDIILTPTPNPAGDEYDKPVTSSIDTAKTVSLTPARGVQAGFLSNSVNTYSSQGLGGLEAKVSGSANLNHFHLIIKDNSGKVVYTEAKSEFGEVIFTWDNKQLGPGEYTASIGHGPMFMFDYSNTSIPNFQNFRM